ncbi:MAG: tail fiber domain-containing protein [Agriterribacter sp.]
MKFFYQKAAQVAASVFVSISVYSQANTSLSNLVPTTTINSSLSPNVHNTINLGAHLKNWKNIYVGSAYYLEDFRIIHQTGDNCFFMGTYAGFSSVEDNNGNQRNTGAGEYALYSNKSGDDNSAFGAYALERNTSVSNNAFGSFSLSYNTTGRNNAGFGDYSLFKNTTGSYNLALGSGTMSFNTTGTNNSAVGYSSMLNSTTSSYNTALGSYTLYTNTTGISNTALGYSALYNNTTGGGNIGIGNLALYANTTASMNIATGYDALYNNTTGGGNVGIGTLALYYNKTGGVNTAIGYLAGPTINNLTNTSAIGYDAVPLASNQIMLGNSSVTSVRAAGSYVIYSDGRFKKDINQNVPGIEFIKLLKPVTYHYAVHDLDKKTGAAQARMTMRSANNANNSEDEANDQVANAAMSEKEKRLYTGFVAQDVEAAAKKINYDFSGVYVPQNENDVYGLSYSDFVVPLVKAVQQLNDSKDSLQELVMSLEERLAKLESMLKTTPSSGLTLSNASIAQNSPNPFSANTIISYSLPQDGVSNAQLAIYDAAGKRLKMYNLSSTQGRGTVNIDAAMLSSGTYQYSLFVNGIMIDTKKMLLVK